MKIFNFKKKKVNDKNPKPSRMLRKALKEAEKIEKGKIKVKSYDNIDELFEDLLK